MSLPRGAAAQAVVELTHTQTLVQDPNADGQANPGDTLEYTVTVRNTGNESATGLSVTTTLDGNTTLIPGSYEVHPLAVGDKISLTEDVGSQISSINLLDNDSGADPGQTLTIVSVSGNSVPGTINTQYGSLSWSANGTVTYSLNANAAAVQNLISGQVVTDAFAYLMSDGSGETNSDALEVVISGTNDLPLANPDSYQAFNNEVLMVDAAHGLLANDTEPESQTLSVVPFTGPTSLGRTVSVSADGSFTYSGSLVTGDNDSFTYTAQDASGGSSNSAANVAAIGRIFYVKNDNPTAGAGTRADPFRNVNDAFASSQNFDRVYIYRGDGTSANLAIAATISANNMEVTGQALPLMLNSMLLVPASQAPVLTYFGSSSNFTINSQTFALRGVKVNNNGAMAQKGIDATYNGAGSFTLTIADSEFDQTDMPIVLSVSAGTLAVNLNAVNVINSGSIGFYIIGTSTGAVTVNAIGSNFNTGSIGFSSELDTSSTGSFSFQNCNFAQNNTGIKILTQVSGSASATLQVDGGNVVSNNSQGIALFRGSSGALVANVLPGNGTNNSVTTNVTGICNDSGNATVSVTPSNQLNGNTSNISNGTCAP